MPQPGWLERQFERARADYEQLPTWMRGEQVSWEGTETEELARKLYNSDPRSKTDWHQVEALSRVPYRIMAAALLRAYELKAKIEQVGI